MPFPLIRFSCDLEPSFSSWYKKGDTCTNGDFLYKCKYPLRKGNFYSVLRASSVSAVSQNNQLKITPMPKRHILRWHILLPFTTLSHVLDKVTAPQWAQPITYLMSSTRLAGQPLLLLQGRIVFFPMNSDTVFAEKGVKI